MITISSTEARQNFGEFLDKGSKEVVIVKRQSRMVGAFIPMSDLAKLRKAKAEEVHTAVMDLAEEAKSNDLTEDILNDILAEVNPS